jgi:hypothetical protein
VPSGSRYSAFFGESLTRQYLAARDAGEVGYQTLDFGDAALVEPTLELGEGEQLGAC